jgi:hypothetical protein
MPNSNDNLYQYGNCNKVPKNKTSKETISKILEF